jgi:hypothetical protein
MVIDVEDIDSSPLMYSMMCLPYRLFDLHQYLSDCAHSPPEGPQPCRHPLFHTCEFIRLSRE